MIKELKELMASRLHKSPKCKTDKVRVTLINIECDCKCHVFPSSVEQIFPVCCDVCNTLSVPSLDGSLFLEVHPFPGAGVLAVIAHTAPFSESCLHPKTATLISMMDSHREVGENPVQWLPRGITIR